MSNQEIMCGDCIDVMQQMQDCCIDAVITDPPYGLSKEPDVAEVMRHWLAGDVYKHGHNGFMSSSWDSFVPGPEYWRECYRVLKPGGYVLAFSSTRTDDLLSIAIRFAGFERRDEIRCEGAGSLAWLYATGFPKSLSVGRAIDASGITTAIDAKAFAEELREKRESAGVSRSDLALWFPEYAEVTKNWERADAGFRVPTEAAFDILVSRLGLDQKWRNAVRSEDRRRAIGIGTKRVDGGIYELGHNNNKYETTTSIATQWQAWGTALKPAWEPILVFRKPFDGTVAANVLEHGTGAMNIDACRIDSGGTHTSVKSVGKGKGYAATLKNGIFRRGLGGVVEPPHALGRWPANFVICHLDDCRVVGEKNVKANGAIAPHTKSAQLETKTNEIYGEIGGHAWEPHGNGDGTETIADWNCAPGCPVAELDRQSGDRRSAGNYPSKSRGTGDSNTYGVDRSQGPLYADAGGASRYFFCAKPSRKERDAGLESLPPRSGGEATDREDDSAGLNNPRAGAGRKGGSRNPHTTVKPIELMRWLVRLVGSQPGAWVLDPFAGSGTTGCACALENVNFIGIEKEAEYAHAAKLRIAHWQQRAGKKRGEPANTSPSESEPTIDSEIKTETKTETGDEMANLPRELAEQVGKARSAGGGTYIQHGDYVFMIKRWYFQKIQDSCIILELVSVESRKKAVFEGDNKVEQEPNAVGSDCSSTVNFDGDGKLSAPANSRGPVLGLFGYKENEVADSTVINTLDEVIGDKQPAAGMLIGCSTFPKEIRSRKGSFITGLNWSCVAKPGEGVNAPEMVKMRLAAMKAGPDKLVEVATKQLAEARATGGAAVPVSTTESTQQMNLPLAPPPSIPKAAPAIPFVDPLAGWTQHPEDANYVYRGTELRLKSELITAASK